MYQVATQFFNRVLSGFSPLQLIGGTVAAQLAYKAIQTDWGQVKMDIQNNIFYLLKTTPYLKDLFAKELAKDFEPQLDSADVSVHKNRTVRFTEMPDQGIAKDALLATIKSICEFNKFGHKVSGAIYRGEENDLSDFAAEIFKHAGYTNPLHPGLFEDIRQCENEVIQWCAKLMHGDNNIMGCINDGGTFSILEAVKAHKKWAKNEKSGMTRRRQPNIVVPKSAHVAFAKAAEYYDLDLIEVDLDPKTHKVDTAKLRKAVNRNTIMIVGSAPNYPHGIVDDIPALSDIALKNNCGLHVDACLGGFLIPFMKATGHELPLFDFRLPGVTSISMDSHKYGYVPKGSSIGMFRKKVGLYQADFKARWQGGLYLTPNMAGSRMGAMILMTWAILAHVGFKGYVQATKDIMALREKVNMMFKEIPELEVIGDPKVNVVAFRFNKATNHNIYLLLEKMKERGWHLNGLQDPAAIHLCVTYLQTEQTNFIETFESDLKWAIEYIKKNPMEQPKGDGATYGAMQKIPGAIAPQLLEMLGREYNFLDSRVEATRPKAVAKLKAS
tara:strand:+ start:24723 stop:26387 length:1665 start_codon:yes stop_codon:yes gene_type:complete